MSQLKRLEQLLGQPTTNQVRVMLLHHSCLHSTWHAEKIERESREALDRFIAKYKISLLLTGHLHEPHFAHWSTKYEDTPPWRVMEIRCGTTTQRDTLPPGWDAQEPDDEDQDDPNEPPPRELPPNTLMVHRITEAPSGEVYWTAVLEVRTAGGFVPVSSTLEPPVRIKVWPQE